MCKKVTILFVLVASALSITCADMSNEIEQKTISALPSNQKVGAPEVSAASPTNGATSVAQSEFITIAFGTKVNTSSVESAFSLINTTDSSHVAGTFTWFQGSSFVFVPATPLSFNSTYQINVDGKTILGKPLVTYTSTFNTLSCTNVYPDCCSGTEEIETTCPYCDGPIINGSCSHQSSRPCNKTICKAL